jgi:hypothetical protein
MVESFTAKAHLRINGLLTLPQMDETLKSLPDQAKIVSSFVMSDQIKRKIEQVGSGYEILKKRVSRQIHNEKNKDAKNFVKVESDQSEDETEDDKNEKSSH